MDKEIFKLVSREDEKIKLFADLAQAQAEVICKGQAETLCKLKAATYVEKSQVLECTLEKGSTPLKNQEEFLGYFFIGGEKYYFESKITVHQDGYFIKVPQELFHLQRRQNYRVRIPEAYHAFYNIIDVNGKPQRIIGNLGDLSSQGCRVVYKLETPIMKVGDNVTGHLVIGKRSPIEIQGLVKHIKMDDGNNVIQTFGIEFQKLTPILENKLFALTMEIHKEVFRRPQ